MKTQKVIIQETIKNRPLLLAIGCVILIWIIESFCHVLMFNEGTIVQQLFFPKNHELWMRILIAAIIIIFGNYVQYITDWRKQKNEEIKAALSELDQIFNISADGMRLIDKEFKVIRINETLSKISGVRKDEAVGKKCYETFSGSLCHTADCPATKIFKGERRVECDIVKERQDGTKVLCIVTAIPFRGPDGTLNGVVEDFKDITKRKKAEEELRGYRCRLEELVKERTAQLIETNEQLQQEITEHKYTEKTLRKSEEKYHTLMNNAGDSILLYDIRGNVLEVNKRAEELTGYCKEELLRMNITQLHPKDELNKRITQFKETIIAGSGLFIDGHILRKDGRIIPIDITGCVIHYGKEKIVQDIYRDITVRKKMEEELLKVQKLESIGTLAGGIAHDFNNLLTAIIGNLSLAKLYEKTGENISELLTIIEKESWQAKQLTQQLLTFSKGGEPIRKNVSLAEYLKNTVCLALSGSKTQCRLSVPDDLWWAEIDEGQMSQALNNLMINASQAMPEGGIIQVWAENVNIKAENRLSLQKGRYIKISVRDRGMGIPEKHLQRIFDPFYTTKEKGSGLGLAITYSILKKHGGGITLESMEGVGTTFHIYIPASEKKIIRKNGEGEEKLYSGKGKILLMDDQPKVRNVAQKMLNYLGYEVELAEDGEQALERYKKAKMSEDAFDAIILDLTVPGGMGGKKAIKKFRELDPQVKAIVSSGYSNDPIMADYKTYGFKGVITKPYTMKELSDILHKLIINTETTPSKG